MEHSIQANTTGVITEVLYQIGDLVEEGDELLRIEVQDA